MFDELDRQHVGGDAFQANRALNGINMVHDWINRLLSDVRFEFYEAVAPLFM